MHNINNTNNAQFDDKNPPASPKVFAFVFFAENRYICTVMQGDTATAQAKRAGGRKTVQNDGRRCGDKSQSRRNSLIYIGLTFMRKSLYPHKATFKRMDFSNPSFFIFIFD